MEQADVGNRGHARHGGHGGGQRRYVIGQGGNNLGVKKALKGLRRNRGADQKEHMQNIGR